MRKDQESEGIGGRALEDENGEGEGLGKKVGGGKIQWREQFCAWDRGMEGLGGVKIEQEGGAAGERDQEDGDLGGMDQYKSRGRRDQEGEDLGEED